MSLDYSEYLTTRRNQAQAGRVRIPAAGVEVDLNLA